MDEVDKALHAMEDEIFNDLPEKDCISLLLIRMRKLESKITYIEKKVKEIGK